MRNHPAHRSQIVEILSCLGLLAEMADEPLPSGIGLLVEFRCRVADPGNEPCQFAIEFGRGRGGYRIAIVCDGAHGAEHAFRLPVREGSAKAVAFAYGSHRLGSREISERQLRHTCRQQLALERDGGKLRFDDIQRELQRVVGEVRDRVQGDGELGADVCQSVDRCCSLNREPSRRRSNQRIVVAQARLHRVAEPLAPAELLPPTQHQFQRLTALQHIIAACCVLHPFLGCFRVPLQGALRHRQHARRSAALMRDPVDRAASAATANAHEQFAGLRMHSQRRRGEAALADRFQKHFWLARVR